MVIHLLATLPTMRGMGLGKKLVDFACIQAKREGAQVIRLDVVDGNYPALRLYESCGFSHVGNANLYYEDTGWMIFMLCEKVLD